jgi:5,10-methylenetetrahydromethanopterin reductase
MVTIPVSRHPMVVASAVSAIWDLSGARSCFALGTSGSAAASMGIGAPTQKQRRDHMLALRDLFSGRPRFGKAASFRPCGWPVRCRSTIRSRGPRPWRPPAKSPRAWCCRSAYRWRRPPARSSSSATGPDAAGRDPMSIDIWAFSFAAVRDRRDAAVNDVKAFLAATGAYTMNQKACIETMPTQFRAKLQELQARYVVAGHCLAGGRNEPLIDKSGLSDYLAEIVAVAGDAGEVAKVLSGLGRIHIQRSQSMMAARWMKAR